MAAHTKFTPEIGKLICDLVRTGVHRRHAAQKARVGKDALYEWLAKGEADEPKPEHAQLVEFALNFREAEADYAIAALKSIDEKRNAGLDWKADSWRLEKFFPGEFGSKVSHEVSGPAGGPIEVSDARAKLLAKLAPKPEPGGSG